MFYIYENIEDVKNDFLKIEEIIKKGSKNNKIKFKFIDSSMLFITDGYFVFAVDIDDEKIDLFDINLTNENILKVFNDYNGIWCGLERMNMIVNSGLKLASLNKI